MQTVDAQHPPCGRYAYRANGVFRVPKGPESAGPGVPDARNPTVPAWVGAERACHAQASADGFRADQTRQGRGEGLFLPDGGLKTGGLKMCQPHGLLTGKEDSPSSGPPRGLAGAIAPAMRCACPTPAGGQSPRPAPVPPMAGASRPPGRALACVAPVRTVLMGTWSRPGRGNAVRFLIRPDWQPLSPDREDIPARWAVGVLFSTLLATGRDRGVAAKYHQGLDGCTCTFASAAVAGTLPDRPPGRPA